MDKKGKPLLSLCMIAKNEEKTLPHCLEAIRDSVDEIVLVDTGSTDQTIPIAKQAGAKVFEVPWNHDFSSVRNVALEKASGKWILFLDADEMILNEEAKQIRNLLKNPLSEGYLFFIDTVLPHQEIPARTQSLRLFRNRPEYRYRNRVFERIPEELLANVADAGITILHRPDPERLEQMRDLKCRLAETEIEEHPEDGYLRYAYGIELLNQQEYARSIEQFEEARRRTTPHHLFAPHLYQLLVWALMKIKKYEEAISIANEGIKFFPFYTDLLFLRGQSYQKLKRHTEAMQDMEKCLRLGDAPPSMVSQPGTGSFRALYALGEIHEELRNKDQALEYYKQAYQTEGRFAEALYRAGSFIKENPDLGEADLILLQWIDPNKPEDVMTLIDILCLEREYEMALKYVAQLEPVDECKHDVAFIKGICATMRGEAEKAEAYFSLIPREHPYYPHVLLRRILNAWFQRQWKIAENLLNEMDQYAQISATTQNVYRKTHALLQGLPVDLFDLDETGAHILAKLLEHFLWMKQDRLAEPLLHWLLSSKKTQTWIPIAVCYADLLMLEPIRKILKQVNDQEIEAKIREKAAKRFYQKGAFQAAEALLSANASLEYGVLGYELTAKLWLHKVREFIKQGMRSRKVEKETKKRLSELLEMIQVED